MTDPRIEAAARAMCGRFNEGDASIWDDLSNSDREYYREAARVVLEAADAAAWRPIETAPHGELVVLAWRESLNGQWSFEIGYASHGWRNDVASNISHHGSATHWMPLPAPPQEAAHD